jgi:hypothetical protein
VEKVQGSRFKVQSQYKLDCTPKQKANHFSCLTGGPKTQAELSKEPLAKVSFHRDSINLSQGFGGTGFPAGAEKWLNLKDITLRPLRKSLTLSFRIKM